VGAAAKENLSLAIPEARVAMFQMQRLKHATKPFGDFQGG